MADDDPPEHLTSAFPFPLRGDRHELSVVAWAPFTWRDLRATLRHVFFAADGSVSDLREWEVVLLHPHHLGDVPWSTVQEAVAAWAERLRARSAEELAAADPTSLDPWAAEEGAVLDERYAAWTAAHLPETEAEAERRRAGALAAATAAFPRLAEHVERVWGLRLPRTLIALDAFFRATAAWPAELRGEAVRPGGVLDRLEPGGWERAPAVDERVHGRFRRDPPEFLPFAWGDSDGQHFGLWFDVPTQAAGVVHNYARDSAETWYAGDRALAPLRMRWAYDPPPADETGFPARRFLEEVAWFEEHDPAPPLPRWARGEGLVGGPASLPAGSPHRETGALRRPAVDREIAAAKRALAAGAPAAALSLGRELWWMDDDATRDDALALLTGAYEALDRGALAAIARAHATHRDRRTVDAFVE